MKSAYLANAEDMEKQITMSQQQKCLTEEDMDSFTEQEREEASTLINNLKATSFEYKTLKLNERRKINALAGKKLAGSNCSTMITDEGVEETAENIAANGYLNLLTVDVQPRSNIPVIGKLISLSKRIARRWVIWYLKPVFDRQSSINKLLMSEVMKIEDEMG